MNKFVKGAIACAALVPCLTGLTACGGEKAYTAENAYSDMMSNVSSMVNKMSAIDKVGTEFQLNVNVSIDMKVLANNIPVPSESMSAKLRAVIGARHTEANKELFGHIGVVDTEDNFTSIFNAYMIDDADDVDGDSDEQFVPLDGTITADTWQYWQGIAYTKDGDNYVLATGDFDATADYYLFGKDLLHFYMESNADDLKYTLLTEEPDDWTTAYNGYYIKVDGEYMLVEAESAPTFSEGEYYAESGFDLSAILSEMMGEEIEVPSGHLYATLNIGDSAPEIPTPGDDNVAEEEMDIMATLNELTSMDFEEFKAMLELPEEINISASKDGGNKVLTFELDGTKIEFIAEADGGLQLVMEMVMPMDEEGTVVQEVSVVVDVDLTNEFEEEYVPTDFTKYPSEAIDLEEMLAGLMG